MKILFILLLFLSFISTGHTQSVLPLRADTVVIEKIGGNSNLKVKDATRDTLGIMTNIGGGVTRFKKPRTLNDTNIIVGNDTLRVIGRNSGGGTGGGITYKFSASALTGTDTAKFWIKTPAKAGVHDVSTYVNGSWQRFGWLAVDGTFSTKRPITIVFAGQSNAAGNYSGGDTARFPGLIGYSSGAANGSIDNPTAWQQVYIGISPFLNSNNNIAFQVAKRIKKNGDADIVRILGTYQGGVGLGAWITTGSHYLLDTLRNRLSRSGLDTIDVFVWHHGESGAVTGETVGGYVVDQRTFYDSLCSQLTTGFKRNYTRYIAGGIGTDTSESAASANVGSSAGQRLLNYEGNLNTAWVPAWGLHTGDGIHFTAKSLDSLGDRYYTEFKRLPHAPYSERAPFNYNETYDGYKAIETDLVPYSGGGYVYKIVKNSQAWANEGGTSPYLTINLNSGGIDVGNANSMGYSGNKTLRVAGNAVISSGTNNLIIAGNFNGTGTYEHVTILGNYGSNFNPSGSSDYSLIAGFDAAYNTNNQVPYNSVILGAEAGKASFYTGTGDYNTFVGWRAGYQLGGRLNAFFGATAGFQSSGEGNTAIGTSTGATSADSTWNHSTALGQLAKWDRSNQVAIGDTVNVNEVRFGKWRYNYSSTLTPTNGQYYAWSSSTGKYELTNAASTSSIPYGSQTANGDYTQNWSHKQLFLDTVKSFRLLSNETETGGSYGTNKTQGRFIWSPDFSNLGFSMSNTIRNFNNTSDSITFFLGLNKAFGARLSYQRSAITSRIESNEDATSSYAHIQANATSTNLAFISVRPNHIMIKSDDSLRITATPAASSDSIFGADEFDPGTKTNKVFKVKMPTVVAGTGISTALIGTETTVSVNTTSSSLPHTINKQFIDANNSGTGETDLYSISVPVNRMLNNGNSVHFEITGNFNDVTATSDLRFYFAGTEFGNTGALTVSSTGAWSARGFVIRATSTTARAYVTVSTPGASTASYTNELDLTGLDFTVGNIFKVTGQAGGAGGGSNDITAKAWVVKFEP